MKRITIKRRLRNLDISHDSYPYKVINELTYKQTEQIYVRRRKYINTFEEMRHGRKVKYINWESKLCAILDKLRVHYIVHDTTTGNKIIEIKFLQKE